MAAVEVLAFPGSFPGSAYGWKVGQPLTAGRDEGDLRIRLRTIARAWVSKCRITQVCFPLLFRVAFFSPISFIILFWNLVDKRGTTKYENGPPARLANAIYSLKKDAPRPGRYQHLSRRLGREPAVLFPFCPPKTLLAVAPVPHFGFPSN